MSVLLGNGDGSFQTQVAYTTDGAPQSMAIGDFNGDGVPDLAAANSNASTVSVLIGKGDGTFQAQVAYAGFENPVSVAVGDFNGDGIADLAVANAANYVSVSSGKGDGTFNPPVDYAPGGNPFSMAVGDFNGDGVVDLAVANFTTGGYVEILLNQLTSTSSATAIDVSIPGVGTQNVEASYPGDNLYGASVSPVTAFMGSGVATTLTLTAAPAGSSFVGEPVTLTATLTPFAAGNATTNGETISFEHNLAVIGTGTLQNGVATFTTTALPVGFDPLEAAYAGDTTFAATTTVPGGYLVNEPATTATALAITVAGNAVTTVASGTAVTLTATVTVGGAPVTPGLVIFCDATAPRCENSAVLGTGQLTAAGTATLKFVPGIGLHSYTATFSGKNGDNTSIAAPLPLTVTGLYPTVTTIAPSGTAEDYTLTGTVVGTGSATLSPTGNVSFLDTSNGNASLGTAPLGAGVPGLTFLNSSSPATGGEPVFVAVGDFNGDGIADIAAANYAGAALSILLGNGDGTFTLKSNPATGINPNSIGVGDFNGDGVADLAVTNEGSATVTVLLGNGDGTFTAVAASPATGGDPVSVTIGDFNGDGRQDLAVANFEDDTVTVLLGNGDGTFTPAASPVTGDNPYWIATGDFNGDGKADLAVTNTTDNTVSVLLGNGDGTFTAGASPGTGNNPYYIVVADFNGDGRPDLAIANRNDSTVSILTGNGDGTFATASTPATGFSPASLAVGDFNADGNADLAVADSGGNTVTVLLGNGNGTFTASAVAPPTGTLPYSVAVGDFNGDGHPDIVAANENSGTLAVLLTQLTQTATATLPNVAITGVGTHNVDASYPASANFGGSVSPTTPLMGSVTAPTIASLAPINTYVGNVDTMVTITGTGFEAGAAVTVNGASQVATVVNATQLTTTIAAANLANAGTLTLTVVNPDGGTSNAITFTVLAQPLVLAPATSLTFGSQTVGTTSSAQVVTITNMAATGFTLSSITVDGGLNPADFAQTNNCPAVLASGASCQVSITFAPMGVGQRASGLVINGFSPTSPPLLPLTGTGTGGILQVSPGNLKTIAGNGTVGYTGNGGPAIAAELHEPGGMGFDVLGNLYFADELNNVIRKVDTAGNITTVAGNGTAGFSGDGGPAVNAQLDDPFGVTVNAAGELYIQDTVNARIRKVDTTGTITTIAGNGQFGFSGDGGPATSAELNTNQGARFDKNGNLYVSDCGNGAIRKIDINGIITTVAGNGTEGFSGDGGPATSAQLYCPSGAAVDSAGNLYIADELNNRIRKVGSAGHHHNCGRHRNCRLQRRWRSRLIGGVLTSRTTSTSTRPATSTSPTSGTIVFARSTPQVSSPPRPAAWTTWAARKSMLHWMLRWTRLATYISPTPGTTRCARSYRRAHWSSPPRR